MSNFGEILTSMEAMVVYAVLLLSSVLVFIIFLVEKYSVKVRQRHNTKELNKLVEQVREETNLDNEYTEDLTLYRMPVIEALDDEDENLSVEELIRKTDESIAEKKEVEPVTVPVTPIVVETPTVKVEVPTITVEEPRMVVEKTPEIIEEKPEELVYASMEPNREEAREELERLTNELKEEVEVENETLTSYEIQQEENAIISLEELIAKSKAMYEANEVTQYADEGNEPISLEELQARVGKSAETYQESFVLEDVVPAEEEVQVEEQTIPQVVEAPQVIPVEEVKRFKSSPIISPVYGIEKENDLNLENTANFEKFDAEKEKTNEFLMTLKELQERM